MLANRPSLERPLDLALALVGVHDAGDAEHRESGADDLVRPGGLVRQRRHDPARGQADRERRQARCATTPGRCARWRGGCAGWRPAPRRRRAVRRGSGGARSRTWRKPTCAGRASGRTPVNAATAAGSGRAGLAAMWSASTCGDELLRGRRARAPTRPPSRLERKRPSSARHQARQAVSTCVLGLACAAAQSSSSAARRRSSAARDARNTSLRRAAPSRPPRTRARARSGGAGRGRPASPPARSRPCASQPCSSYGGARGRVERGGPRDQAELEPGLRGTGQGVAAEPRRDRRRGRAR